MRKTTRKNRDPLDRARDLIGAEYKHLGRDRRGVDCLGLFFYAYDIDEKEYQEVNEARRLLMSGYYKGRKWRFDRRNPDHLKSCEILQSALTKHLLTCRLNDLKRGDVLLMSFKNKTEGQGDHVAIYAGDGRLIHSDFEEGVVEVDIEERITWKRIVAAYRRES